MRKSRRDSFIRQSVFLPDPVTSDTPTRGTRNALAIARANMGYGDSSPQMAERNNDTDGGYYSSDIVGGYATDAPYDGSNGGAYGYAPNTGYGAYDNNNNTQGYDGGAYDANGSPRGNVASVTPYQAQQYAEINRQLNHPAHNNGSSPFSDPEYPSSPSGTGSDTVGGLSRKLSTTYGSGSHYSGPAASELSEPTRTGTPVDPNPQQTYLAPGRGGPYAAPGSMGSRYEEGDAYGGM